MSREFARTTSCFLSIWNETHEVVLLSSRSGDGSSPLEIAKEEREKKSGGDDELQAKVNGLAKPSRERGREKAHTASPAAAMRDPTTQRIRARPIDPVDPTMEAGVAKIPVPIILKERRKEKRSASVHILARSSDRSSLLSRRLRTHRLAMSMTALRVPIRLLAVGTLSKDSPSPLSEAAAKTESKLSASSVEVNQTFFLLSLSPPSLFYRS